ncbi:MAG: Crp/Fnr family transcriptional regulator [Chloroflexi bacterium]|nr:Crp/Fnr family transcriptional regulator [Chloroflexota bacterium]
MSLRGIDLFEGLDDIQQSELMSLMPVERYRKNAYIFETGDDADSLYLVQDGVVKLAYINLNGEEKVLGILQKGDTFGDLFLGRFRSRIGSAQSLSAVTVCRLRETDFLAILHRFPRIALNFIRRQANEHRQTVARMQALMGMSARERLLGTLLTLARRYCCEFEDWFTLHETLTQEDLANMTGLNRTTVSEIINDLRREGILGGSGRIITVNRKAVLSSLEESGVEILE